MIVQLLDEVRGNAQPPSSAVSHHESCQTLTRFARQGADVNALADSPFERGGESVHCTALQVAVATKQPEVAQLLLERGADPNIGDHEAKITPLMYTKCVKCQQLLLDAKADITVFDQLFGRNAFHWACYDGKVIANRGH